MAAAAAVKEKEASTALQTTATAALPAELMEELAADAGAGTSSAADDNILPFISLLQDMSPEVKKRDPEYVEGAEPGMLLNKATRQLYAGNVEQAEQTGLPILEFQHCAFQRCINEWIPRNDGGGFVARHELRGTPEETMKALGGKQVQDSQDPDKMVWKTADGKHDLIDTRYHYGNAIDAEGSPNPGVISFSSTGHTASREWMTMMRNFKIRVNDRLLVAAAWSKKYRILTKPRKNKKGDFFVVTVQDGGIIADKALRDAGKALHAGFEAGTVRTADEVAPAGNGDADAPI
jgi:hypothetical protein